jgi:hypothetical protein
MLIVCMGFFISSFVQPLRVDGSDNDRAAVQVLSKESIIDLALKNYVDVKLAQLRLRAAEGQLEYARSQKNIASEVEQAPIPSRLPTLPEDLLEQIPNYDQLSDEEKAEVDQMIMIQSMINHSFNQFLDVQNAEQYDAILKEKEINLLSLGDNVRSLVSEKEIAYLELEKMKRLVEFYAVKQYYRLLNAGNSLKSAEIEASYFDNRVKDAQLLYKYGKITEIELEQAKSNSLKQWSISNHVSRQYDLQLKMFKSELGIDTKQAVIIEAINLKLPNEGNPHLSVKLEDNFELRQADEAIRLAKENYDSVSKSNLTLSSYYLTVWNAKKEEKAVVKQQLELRLLQLEQEGNALFAEAKQLADDKVILIQKIQDYETLLLNGRITVRDLEDLQLELAKLDIAIDNANRSYGIFQEKQALASKGILLGSTV